MDGKAGIKRRPTRVNLRYTTHRQHSTAPGHSLSVPWTPLDSAASTLLVLIKKRGRCAVSLPGTRRFRRPWAERI